MDTSRIRVEIIRFALLLTVTLALISVATRIHDKDGSKEAGARSGPSATAAPTGNTPSAGGSSAGGTSSPSAGATSSGTPDTSPPDSGTSSPVAGGSGGSGAGGGGTSGSGTSGGGGSGGSGSGGTGDGSTTTPVLPRTGTDDAVRLTGLAFLLLGAGSFSISLSRR